MTDALPPEAGKSNVRYHGLDALRAGAMALGVVLHAAAPYLRHPMEGLVWAVDGPAAGSAAWPWLDAVFWWLHAWRVPLFFVMAGFFAAMLVERRGVRAFLRHRRDRLLVPLAASCVVLLPICYFAFAWGWTATGRATWSEVLRLSFGEGLRKDDVLGPAHLWFLVYLGLFTLVYAAAASSPAVKRVARRAAGVLRRPFAWAGVVVVTAALAAVEPAVALTFENDFVPRPVEFVYQGWFFLVGVGLYGVRDVFDRFARGAWWLTGVAILSGAGLIGVLPSVFAWPITREGVPPIPMPMGAVFAAAWAGACWLTIFALLAAAIRWLGRPRAWVRWLSDSAYWVYLVHVPVVAAAHVALHGTIVPPGVRFLLALAVAIAFTLTTYRFAVRYTFLGAALHGPRHRPAPAGAER